MSKKTFVKKRLEMLAENATGESHLPEQHLSVIICHVFFFF